MTDAATLEAIRRVEQTPLRELVNVSVDDVTTQMEALLSPELDISSFYNRWETQQWAVSDLDFSVDAVQWPNIPDAVRLALRRTMILFFVGEQIVTDTLAPVLHAAPREDERIFLATQIADEARHTVFFERFFAEVLEHQGGIRAAMAEFRPRTRASYRRVFDVELINAIDACRLNPGDPIAFVNAIVTYHLVIEGYLALGGQRSILQLLRRVGLLPGFINGFTAVARDESRHIGFGVLALRRRVIENPELGRVIATRVYDLLPAAVDVVVGPDEKLPFDDISEVPEPMRIDSLEARNFAIGSLGKRLRSAGLSAKVVDDIAAEMRLLYDKAWAGYETNYGLPHPVRHWQRIAASARHATNA